MTMLPKKTPAIEIRQVGDEVLVHDSLHDKVHVLNRTAGFVLELCDGTRSATEIARSLSVATGAEIAVANRDVEAVLREFTEVQLIAGETAPS